MKSLKEKINTTEFEIIKSQELWAQNVIEIGNLYNKNEDYKTKAGFFVKQFYAFDVGEVLFKPTLASEKQFRYSYDDALSYFIGGHISEDKGFALKPWKKIKKFISNWGGKSTTKIVKLSNSDDKYSHILAGDIISPNQTEHAKKTIVTWIKNLK